MKLKNFLGKALIIGAVSAITFAMGAVSAFADDINYGKVSTSGTKSKTWDFTENKPTSNQSVTDSILGIVKNGGTVSMHKDGYLSCNSSAIIRVPVPTDSVGKIELLNKSSYTDRTASVEGSESQGLTNNSGKGAEYSFTAVNTADGYVDVTFNNKEAKLLSIIVTLTSGDFDVIETYKVTGSCSGLAADSVIVFTNVSDNTIKYNATVNSDGNGYTIEDTKAITEGNYTLSATSYNTTYASGEYVSISGENATPAVTFSLKPLSAISEGTYNSFVLPDFEGEDNGTAGKYNDKATIDFILAKTSTVTITAKCGSGSGSEKTATFSVSGIASANTHAAGGSTKDEDFVLPSGKHTITVTTTGGSSLQISKIVVKPLTTVPTLSISASGRTYTGTISNVSETYPISSISVVDSENAKVGDINNIKVDSIEEPSEYTFTTNFTGSNDLSGVKFAVTYKVGDLSATDYFTAA